MLWEGWEVRGCGKDDATRCVGVGRCVAMEGACQWEVGGLGGAWLWQ